MQPFDPAMTMIMIMKIESINTFCIKANDGDCKGGEEPVLKRTVTKEVLIRCCDSNCEDDTLMITKQTC